MPLPFLALGHILRNRTVQFAFHKKESQDLLDAQHKTEPRVCGQASSVFVKPLTQQSVLAAIRSKWHSKFALHPRSTTIRLRIKQGMAARAGPRIQLRARRRPRR